MSQWMDIDADLVTPVQNGVQDVLATVPTGSESGPLISDLRDIRPGCWAVHGSMRDMAEEDVPEVRDWFRSVIERLRATEAVMQLDGYRYTYIYKLDGGTLTLQPRMWND